MIGLEERMFFFEKKNQKTFVPLDHAGGTTRRPGAKVFLLLFFQKKQFLL